MTQVPPCDPSWIILNEDLLNGTSQPTYIYLAEPEEVREDHLTFFIGILILMFIALGCTFTLSKLTKPKLSVGYGSVSNYDFMMWMPSSRASRRSSIMVLLRGITCRTPSAPTNRNGNALSIVSNMSMTLPSYQTATSSTPVSTLIPPPPYYELQRLTEPLVTNNDNGNNAVTALLR